MKGEFLKGAEDIIEKALDMVPGTAADYIENIIKGTEKNKIRFIEQNVEADKIGAALETALERSTHNIAGTRDRRELHRSILREQVAAMEGLKPEKPILIYFAGPMGAGKSTLIEMFGERIIAKSEAPYAEKDLEEAYQSYKEVLQCYLKSDFALYKRRLPEFNIPGNKYGVIRAEAHALAMAIDFLAKKLGCSEIKEELGDGAKKGWVKEKGKHYKVVAIGVTSDPAANAQGLRERCRDKNENINDAQLARTIIGFSSSDAFAAAAAGASQAVLLDSSNGYKVICAWDNGVQRVVDAEAHEKFLSYADMSQEDLVFSFDQGDEGADVVLGNKLDLPEL